VEEFNWERLIDSLVTRDMPPFAPFIVNKINIRPKG
jgi:hypothetical protein